MELDKHLTLSLMQLVEIKFETSFGGMTLFFEVQWLVQIAFGDAGLVELVEIGLTVDEFGKSVELVVVFVELVVIVVLAVEFEEFFEFE